jgi:hypothetical protein
MPRGKVPHSQTESSNKRGRRANHPGYSSHFSSSASGSAYVNIGDIPRLEERAVSEEEVELGDRSLRSDKGAGPNERDGPGEGHLCRVSNLLLLRGRRTQSGEGIGMRRVLPGRVDLGN